MYAGGGTYGPNTLITHINIQPKPQHRGFRQYFFEQPVDDRHTRIFFLNMRDFLLDPEMDGQIHARNKIIATQDIDVLTDVNPVRTPVSTTRELLMPADKAIVAYRDWLSKFDELGWRIDWEQFQRRDGRETAFAIPSPGPPHLGELGHRGRSAPEEPCRAQGERQRRGLRRGPAMLINNWYVAAESGEVTKDKPLGVRMLGCDFVLYRTSGGQAVCLSDVCCHRGASLAKGELVSDHVACPYHGWEYSPSGSCTKIPALGSDTRIPRRVRVDQYPTEEKYGWVWAFLGDLPELDRPKVPDLFPEFDDRTHWQRIPYRFEANANWVRFEENSLDTAHTNFVHRAFGSRRNPRLQSQPIEEFEWGARVSRVKPAPALDQKHGEIAKLLAVERNSTRVTLEFSLVGLCHRIQPTFREDMSQINFTARTPIDAYHSRALGWQARNYLLDPEYDRERMNGILQAVEEDLRVVESVKPKLTPRSLAAEFLTETDGMELAFRKRVFKWARRGWEIDVEQLERLSRDQVLVIPSPARRLDPSNWVHATVPLRPAANED